jgi:N-hydroxyarylamine O-acetyltransferase
VIGGLPPFWCVLVRLLKFGVIISKPMPVEFDLQAYLARIGLGGRLTRSFETLAAIHQHHAESIAFENLDPLLRRPVHLDAASLQRKLVNGGRGGYCFEHNSLLGYALTELGFEVTGLAARVLWNAPPGNVPGARSHMLLLVNLSGIRYVADVGFGGQTLTGPLKLEADLEQVTPHEPFRLLRAGQSFEMQTRIGDVWKSMYRFDLQEQVPADYEVSNWYLSNHPKSHFLNTLIAARPDRGRRFALFNNELTTHHLGGKTERRILDGAVELRATLQDVFLIEPPGVAELEAVLNRLVPASAHIR